MTGVDPGSDLALARAVDDLRRGEAISVRDGEVVLHILAAELATVESLGGLEAAGRAELLLSPERAATLNILNQRAAAGTRAVAVTRMPWLDLVASIAAADPVADLETPFKGPFPTRPLGAEAGAAEAAIALAKRAGLLPALFFVAGGPPVSSRLAVEA
ncbi:MAG: GTP cyclohydrolase II, partial [Thermaurantiacus sp.]